MASQQLENIGLALQGFSAGLQGQLPQFQAVQNQGLQLKQQQAEQQQKMMQERQMTMFTDANAALKLLDSGDIDSVVKLGINRLQGLKQLSQMDPNIDPSDTQRLTQLAVAAKNGDETAMDHLRGELQSTVKLGYAYGLLKAPEEKEGFTLSPGQTRFDAKGEEVASIAPEPEKAPAEYEILTKAQKEALGLPADAAFKRNKQTQEVSSIGGAQTVVNVGRATEGERTAGILANRLDFAQSQINDILANAPEAESPEMLPTAFNAVGLDYLARLTNPAERQVIEAAQDDMLDAALTLGTGAAYTAEQLKGYRRSYFPQLGDEPRTIEAKAERLSNLLDAAYEKAGRGAPEVRRSATSGAPKAGDVMDGYRFKGGDPADPASWEKL